MSTWALIYNPVAGGFRPRRLEAVLGALTEAGIRVEAFATGHAGHATELARGVEGVDTVAVFGGDSTLNEALNGVLGRGIPLAFILGGTANVVAHELGLRFHPALAAKSMAAGRARTVRPGVVDSRAFLLWAGFGYDADVVAGINPAMKRRIGKGAFVLSGVRALMRRGAPVFVDSGVDSGGDGPRPYAWVVAARAGRYAGPYVIHGGAGLEREGLGLVVVPGWKLPAFLAGRFLLRHPPGKSTALPLPESGCTVWSDGLVSAQVDGEFLGGARSFRVCLSDRTVPLVFLA